MLKSLIPAGAAALLAVASLAWAALDDRCLDHDHGAIAMATCTGAAPCKACKNCNACKHCKKDGGTCGTCKKPAK